jgi:hypothetical protein
MLALFVLVKCLVNNFIYFFFSFFFFLLYILNPILFGVETLNLKVQVNFLECLGNYDLFFLNFHYFIYLYNNIINNK